MAKINLQTKGCEVTEELEAHFEEKMQTLEKHWSIAVDAQVRVSQHRGRHAAEITLLSNGLMVRGEEKAASLRQAFDLAVEKLDSQLRRFKEKSQTRTRRHNNRDDVSGTVSRATLAGAGIAADGISTQATAVNTSSTRDDEADDEVVRVKRFALKPMSTEEASMQMDMLGHSFFVFRDAGNNQVSVVYRRHDGGVGLIEPVAD